jgi:hypothetical protein
MYMWYESAAICYIYLIDLPGDCPRLVETRTQRVITAKLVDCDTHVAAPVALKGPGKTNCPIPIQSNLPPMDDDEAAGQYQEIWVSRLEKCQVQGLLCWDSPRKAASTYFATAWAWSWTFSDSTGLTTLYGLQSRILLDKLRKMRTVIVVSDFFFSLFVSIHFPS